MANYHNTVQGVFLEMSEQFLNSETHTCTEIEGMDAKGRC